MQFLINKPQTGNPFYCPRLDFGKSVWANPKNVIIVHESNTHPRTKSCNLPRGNNKLMRFALMMNLHLIAHLSDQTLRCTSGDTSS